MAEYFGSDSTFKQLKKHYARGDMETLAEELLGHIKKACRVNQHKMGMEINSEMDLQDMESAAFLHVWTYIPRFLEDPRNDPDNKAAATHFCANQRHAWLLNLVRHAMITELKKNITGNNGCVVEYDVYETGYETGTESSTDGNPDKVRPVYLQIQSFDPADHAYTSIADPTPSPETAELSKAALTETMDLMFALQAKTETLVIVSYAIIAEFAVIGISREIIAKRLNGSSLRELRRQMGSMLRSMEIDDRLILRGLDKLLEKADCDAVLEGITPGKINNRKSSVIHRLRQTKDNQETGGESE